MADLDEIIAHLDGLLGSPGFPDYGPNGLQVPGRPEVRRVVTGVSAGAELFERAIAAGADLVLVHHGLFWDRQPLALDRPAARRLRMLLDADVSLAAYHLPLDAHPTIGNNALLAQALGAQRLDGGGEAVGDVGPRDGDRSHGSSPAIGDGFALHAGRPIGVVARFPGPDGIGPGELVARARDTAGGREPLAFLDGPERVRTIGIVSGGGSPYLDEAIALGLDAFLTGEPVERVMLRAREAGIHYIAAGHYATETNGVRRLGELLAERFGVEHGFVDVPNPI